MLPPTANSPTPEVDNEIFVEGMHCTGCAAGIEKHLRQFGLDDVAVDYATSTVYYAHGDHTVENVAQEIERLGYTVRRAGSKVEPSSKPSFPLEAKLIISAILTAPLLLHMVVPWEVLHRPLVQFLFTLPVFLIGTLHFGVSAWRSTINRSMNMDVLIFLGASAAFAYSLAGTIMELGPDFLFYETAATIITAALLGNLMERRSIKKTTSAIEELSKIQVDRVKIVTDGELGSSTKETDVSNLKVGQVVRVNSGDRLPSDGELVWGDITVDESMLTGESAPVRKVVGDNAVGGTIVSSGAANFKTTAVGSDTVLAGIIKLVRDTQKNRPEIQRLGDKVSAVFVPTILVLAGLTFFIGHFLVGFHFTQALLNAVAVLVVACPCAMGLATPTAVMVGIGRAVREGILIKGGAAIEKLAAVEQVAFDKTGTLTTGQFRPAGLETFGVDEATAKSLIASIEEFSSHPVARSLTKHFTDAPRILFTSVKEIRGAGMIATQEDGSEYRFGSPSIAENQNLPSDGSLYLLRNGGVIAKISVQDDIKSNARAVIGKLKALGIKCYLISGDQENKSRAVGEAVGIDKVYSQQKPDQKLAIIRELQSASPMAFVGDGINDAPALAQASVGVSLSDATQVAIQSAQVVLLNGNLDHLYDAIRISKRTLRTIKQNLFWALFYNIVAIPVAAAGFLSPMVAAITMAFSDVIVIGNSLRLRSIITTGETPDSPD